MTGDAGTSRLGLLVAVAVIVAAVWGGMVFWAPAELVVEGRRDLVFDQRRVELVAGFDDHTELEVWNDVLGANPDRDEVSVLLPREGVLRWHALARPGRFVASVARRVQGPDEDRTECYLTVRAMGQRGVSRRVPVPPVAANPEVPAGAEREGPSTAFELDLPEGARALEIVTESPAGRPDASLVLLQSAHVVQEPARVSPADYPLHVEQVTQWLLPAVETHKGRFVYARRQPLLREGQAGLEWEDVSRPLVEAVGSFTGPAADGRPALALLGRPASASRMRVSIGPDTILRAAVALDDVMPPGTTADLMVLVDGELVTTVTVDDRAWREVRVPLGNWAHDEFTRALELRLDADTAHLEPANVERLDADYTKGDFVMNVYRARTTRVGVANPRLVQTATVPRRTASRRRLSVLFVHVETLRADVLGSYGGVAGLTPNLDLLAGESVVWDQAFTPSPWTIPSTVSHFTGLLPSAHGATDHDRNVVPGDVPTLAERSRDAGIMTAGIVTNDLLQPAAGYARGFNDYAMLPYANARQVTSLAEAWLEDHVGQQFFLFLHLFDPHHPFNAPGEFRGKYVEDDVAGLDVGGAPGRLNRRLMAGEEVDPEDPDVRLLRGRYLGEVAWLDQQVGRLLDTLERLGLDETTAVVFTADHGEEFLEHGLHGHGSNLYEESLRVPLIIRAPGDPLGPPQRVTHVVSTAGLFTTLLELMSVEGHWTAYPDLLERQQRFAFSETHKGVLLDWKDDPLRRFMVTIRSKNHQLIWKEPVTPQGEPEWDFYDLLNDPGATRRLVPSGPVFDQLAEVMRRMTEWSEDHRAAQLAPGGHQGLMETLQELGYVGGGDGGD